ncbi:MAG: hypothetical protein IPM82_28125 [Saprospiraceae bacterium]|nr:hypothetical protein [Saprospiraceae bacterium]
MKACRQENYPELTPDSLLNLALAKLDTALIFDEEAAYVYFEKGYLYFFNSANHQKAADYFEITIQLSSEWVLPNYFAGRTQRFFFNREKGLTYLKKAIALDSFFLPTYREMAFFESPPQDSLLFEAYVKKMDGYVQEHLGKVPVTYYNYMGNSFLEAEKIGGG